MPKDNQSELFVWVDEDDNKLGIITRREAHGGSRKIHRVIVTLIFNQDKTKLLFQQRSLFKDINPGKWSCGVGGHVNPNGSYETAAIRELSEELGIVECNVKFISKFLDTSDEESELLSIFETCISEQTHLKLDISEVQTTLWCKRTELKEFISTHHIVPNTIKILSQLGYYHQ